MTDNMRRRMANERMTLVEESYLFERRRKAFLGSDRAMSGTLLRFIILVTPGGRDSPDSLFDRTSRLR